MWSQHRLRSGLVRSGLGWGWRQRLFGGQARIQAGVGRVLDSGDHAHGSGMEGRGCKKTGKSGYSGVGLGPALLALRPSSNKKAGQHCRPTWFGANKQPFAPTKG
jgi:hypothetical protein